MALFLTALVFLGRPGGEQKVKLGGNAVLAQLDTGVAHSARVWNYLLGGKDNFAADREAGALILEMFPGIARIARVQRRFLTGAVRYLAADAGIRQFLDIGTGLPAASNTHQVAQQIAPQSRIVYVDNNRFKSGCTHARTSSARVHRDSVTILVVEEPLR